MISQLTMIERSRLEAEIDQVLRSLGHSNDNAAELDSLAKAFEGGLRPGGVAAERVRLWAALLRRRAMCIRTARLAAAG